MATRPTRRATKGALHEALAAAPREYPEATTEEKAALARSWTEVTGQQVKDSMRLTLAVIQRVHGPNTVAVLRTRFAATGTTNLMIEMLGPAEAREDRAGARIGAPLVTEPDDDLWAGWRQVIPGSVVEEGDGRPSRSRRPRQR